MLALLDLLGVSFSGNKLAAGNGAGLAIPTSLVLPLISGLAISLLIGTSVALGFRAKLNPLSIDQIAPLLDDLRPGAVVARFVRDVSGLHAIIELDDGQLWVARRMGADISLRNLRRDQITSCCDTQNSANAQNPAGLDIRSHDIGFGRLRLRFAEPVPDWLTTEPSERLEPR